MKIEYKFVDGTVTEIEVDGSLGEFMLEMKNEGDRVERKETRRHVLLSAVDPEEIIRRGKMDFSTNKAALRFARVILEKYNTQQRGGRKLPYRFKG